jgi:hypothetical protein
MIFVIITWLVRYGHVLGGGLWVGGYALLALVIIPLLEQQRSNSIEQAAIKTVRVLTYAGTATMLFGLVLITRTRGFAGLFSGGEWGGSLLSASLLPWPYWALAMGRCDRPSSSLRRQAMVAGRADLPGSGLS